LISGELSLADTLRFWTIYLDMSIRLTEENRIILIQETRKKDESGALHLGINKGYIAWKKTFSRNPSKVRCTLPVMP
jgi:hypothetical protein